MKKLNGLDKYVIFCISITLIYTVIEFIVSTITGISHDTLTTCLYAAYAGEFISCALIKIFKIRKTIGDV